MIPSHHILCAGRAGVGFARLAAEALVASCPSESRKDLRIFVHLDAMPRACGRQLAEWFSENPHIHTTWGLFGIRNAKKAINWHQRMINRVAALFAAETRIVFVDADLFLESPSEWWQIISEPDPFRTIYAHSLGLRKERTLHVGEPVYQAMKTVLFTLSPAIHNAVNTQVANTDHQAAKALAREFPAATLVLGPFADTQVIASLRAQALGYQVIDVETKVSACHVGGFSHLSASKLREGQSSLSTDRWLQRLRLHQRVCEEITRRGWGQWLDHRNLKSAAAMRQAIERDAVLSAKWTSLKRSKDEKIFDSLRFTSAERAV